MGSRLKKQFVHLVLFTEVEGKQGALLIKRSPEKGWNGVYHLSAQGILLKGENLNMAVLRLAERNLGTEIYQSIWHHSDNLKKIATKTRADGSTCSTFIIQIDDGAFREKLLHAPARDRIRFFFAEEIACIRDAKAGYNKKKGILGGEVGMFPDELNSLHLAFENLPH